MLVWNITGPRLDSLMSPNSFWIIKDGVICQKKNWIRFSFLFLKAFLPFYCPSVNFQKKLACISIEKIGKGPFCEKTAAEILG